MSILPGKRLGPYETLSAIGAGGIGEVYRARDTRLDRIIPAFSWRNSAMLSWWDVWTNSNCCGPQWISCFPLACHLAGNLGAGTTRNPTTLDPVHAGCLQRGSGL